MVTVDNDDKELSISNQLKRLSLFAKIIILNVYLFKIIGRWDYGSKKLTKTAYATVCDIVMNSIRERKDRRDRRIFLFGIIYDA